MEKKLRDMTFRETTFEIINCRQKIAKLHIIGNWLSEETRKVWSDLGLEMQRLEDLDKHLNIRWRKEGLQQISWQEREKMRNDKKGDNF